MQVVEINNKIVNYQCINGEIEHKASFKNKTGCSAEETHSDTKRNIPGGFSFAITFLYSTYSINIRAEQN